MMFLCFLGVFIGAVPKASKRPPPMERRADGGRAELRRSKASRRRRD